MPASLILNWATPAEVLEQLLDVLQQDSAAQNGEDTARQMRSVLIGMGVAEDDIIGYLSAGRGISIATLSKWANKKAVYIDQAVYRTLERISGLSLPSQDKKPSQFDHRAQFKDEKWSPTDAAGNILSGDITEIEDGDDVIDDGPEGRGNSSVYIGRLRDKYWDTKKTTRW